MKILLQNVFFLFFSICLLSNAYADIFQLQDENGRIVFTDRPSEHSQRKVLKQPLIIKFKKSETKISDQKNFAGFGELKVKQKKAKPYTIFAIISPKNDAAVRNNIGNIQVKLEISPPLQTKFGHYIKLEYDGKVQKTDWKTGSILLSNLDRGSHRIKASIVDSSGKRLKTSKTVLFHLQRFSRLFK